MATKIPSIIGEYTILPIIIPPTTAYPTQATHHLYLRPHTPKIPTATDSRSLFLLNVPIDSTAAHLRAVFASLVGPGRFENIVFERDRKSTETEDQTFRKDPQQNGSRKRKRQQQNTEGVLASNGGDLPRVWDRDIHRSGSTAVVLFVDSKSTENVLKAVRKVHKTGSFPIWGIGPEGQKVDSPPLGSKRYLTHHSLMYADKAVIQASVDAFMSDFNSKEEEAARAAKRARNVPDEDGFITVTRGGRTGPARMKDAEEARRKELEKEEEKKKTMGDFYRFQGRERRKEEQGELIRRFEEDRRKVQAMKERRGKFRPE